MVIYLRGGNGMYKFGKAVVKLRLPILILALALIITAWLELVNKK